MNEIRVVWCDLLANTILPMPAVSHSNLKSRKTGVDVGSRITVKYFAYGSNMGVEQMRQRGVHFVSRIFAALQGWRLEFNKLASRNPQEGFANIVSDPTERVEGVLYEFDEEDLFKLDRYEGYPDHYARHDVDVIADGCSTTAIAYVAQPDKTQSGLKPSHEYIGRIKQGTDLLSAVYRDRLLTHETLD